MINTTAQYGSVAGSCLSGVLVSAITGDAKIKIAQIVFCASLCPMPFTHSHSLICIRAKRPRRHRHDSHTHTHAHSPGVISLALWRMASSAHRTPPTHTSMDLTHTPSTSGSADLWAIHTPRRHINMFACQGASLSRSLSLPLSLALCTEVVNQWPSSVAERYQQKLRQANRLNYWRRRHIGASPCQWTAALNEGANRDVCSTACTLWLFPIPNLIPIGIFLEATIQHTLWFIYIPQEIAA